jgi:Deoxyribonuclease II
MPRLRTGARTAFALAGWLLATSLPAFAADAPAPLLAKDGAPVEWWFAFKFNSSKTFAGCEPARKERAEEKGETVRQCIFGGVVQTKPAFGQQFAFASSEDGALRQGKGCAGATLTDPIGATFDQVYNGSFHYLIWNDQFYRDPAVSACTGDSCGAPWGHSKGLLAWNDAGDGFVMQVSTPAWPRSGSSQFDTRKGNKGNTLGCNSSNNNLRASQHFFALRLKHDGLVKVLDGLKNASVVTDPTSLQIVRNGGPQDVQERVRALGKRQTSKDEQIIVTALSSDVMMISKPSGLQVPPWQMVSSLLNSEADATQSNAAERAATWWTKPWIPTTTKSTRVSCWDDTWAADTDNTGKKRLPTRKPGAVEIAKSGVWDEQDINLIAPSNHAKIGTAVAGDKKYAIFGDLNQQGGIAPPGCGKSQNARGGLFFAVANDKLFEGVKDLIHGATAPLDVPSK